MHLIPSHQLILCGRAPWGWQWWRSNCWELFGCGCGSWTGSWVWGAWDQDDWDIGMHDWRGASRCYFHAQQSMLYICIVWVVQLTCSEVTGLAKCVAHSDQLHRAFEKYCDHTSLKPLTLRHPVATQWNLHCKCLGQQLVQWAVVTCLCKSTMYSCHKLEKYALTACEWDILKEMQPILQACNSFSDWFYILTHVQMFEKVIKHILQLESVLVHQVIPIIDYITMELEKVVDN